MISREISQEYDENSAASDEVAKVSCSRVLLAALCTPTVESNSNTFGTDIERERGAILGALLDFSGNQSRSGLISQLAEDEFPARSHPEVEELYKLLEVSFRPLHFGKSLAKIFKFLGEHEELKMYVDRLDEVAFYKLLQQLSRVYSTIEISQIEKMLLPRKINPLKIQRDLAAALKDRVVHGYIDHSTGVVTFELESIESPDMRYKLAEIASSLRACVKLIEKPDAAAKRAEMLRTLAQNVTKSMKQERRALLERRELIEKIKEVREAQDRQRSIEEAQKEKELEEAAAAAEADRRAKKAEARKLKAEKREKDAADKKKAKAMAEKLEELAKKAAPVAGKKKKVKKAEEILHEIEEKKSINAETFVKDEIRKVLQQLREVV